MTNIKSITPIGKHQAYDLEVDHPDHQFYLANGVLTSNSHAVAYAIDSYWCAWLMTYYEEEWLAAYLESMSGNDDSRAKAFSEVRSLGYDIVPLDVKEASTHWKVLPGKRLMPSLVACKGVGATAAQDLESLRPFETLEELLWDDEGRWRPTKFNKKALEAMIHVGAFESLNCVGEDRYFKNYHHMHKVLIENNGEIKKHTKKEPFKGKQRFFELIREHSDTPPWTRDEFIKNIIDHFGSLDVKLIMPKEIVNRLEQKGITSIDEYRGKDVYWFCVSKAIPKKTRNGKNYLLMEIVGPAGAIHKMFMWSWDCVTEFKRYSIVLGEISRTEFGFTTSQRKLRTLDVG